MSIFADYAHKKKSYIKPIFKTYMNERTNKVYLPMNEVNND